MQFVRVNFTEIRDVLINGQRNGQTNQTIRVDAGTHEFRLEGIQNFSPDSVTAQVTGTTVIRPLKIAFQLS
jgi:hypothetical protein